MDNSGLRYRVICAYIHFLYPFESLKKIPLIIEVKITKTIKNWVILSFSDSRLSIIIESVKVLG